MGKRERQRKYREFRFANHTISQYQKLREQEDVPMILVNPFMEIQIVSMSDKESAEILEADDEVIFETGIPDIYLSCVESDLIQAESGCYLLGVGLIYKLDNEDYYQEPDDDDIEEIVDYLCRRKQRIRISGICFPVLRLTSIPKEQKEAEFFAGRS